MTYQSEDELTSLVLSIRRRTARLRSQIEALKILLAKRDSFADSLKAEYIKLSKDQDESEDVASVGSVTINYANEKLWFSPTASPENIDEVRDLNPWRLIKETIEDRCNNCRYKQLVEENPKAISVSDLTEKSGDKEPLSKALNPKR